MEKASEATRAWVWQALVGAVEDARLSNVFITVFTETEPRIDPDLAPIVDLIELSPLGREEVAEFMRRKGLSLDDRIMLRVAEKLVSLQPGNMRAIAVAVDALLEQEQGAA